MLRSFKLGNYVGYSATRMRTNRIVRGQEGKNPGKPAISPDRIGKTCEDLELNPSRRRVSSKRSKRLKDRQGLLLLSKLERRFLD